jgi:sugar lactone lactonase YvrE
MQRIARGYSIVEGPVWDSSTRSLLFCDGITGGVWALRPGRAFDLLIPKRRCSGMALNERGGVVVSGRNVGWKNGNASARLLELDPILGMSYFNDLGTSNDGRVYVGSLDYDLTQPHRTPLPGTLARTLNDKHLIELPMLIGAYQMIAYVQHSLRIRLRPGNQGMQLR